VVLRSAPARTTYADLLLAGERAPLVDVAASAASWSGAPVPEQPRGATVGLTLQYLEAGRGHLLARARVLRRGRLCACDVEVLDGDGALVAKGLVTYRLG
jgi:acyl-coenzyme A thioesterase PaaI-like protein